MNGASTAKKRHNRLPAIAQAGPVSLWMILFVTIPMLFIIFISFMTRGDVVAGNYDILDADNSIVCVVNKDFAKSTLTVTVEMEDRELFCIAAAVCIDSLSMNVVPALQMT